MGVRERRGFIDVIFIGRASTESEIRFWVLVLALRVKKLF